MNGTELYYLGVQQFEERQYDSALEHFYASFDKSPHFKTAQRIAEILIIQGQLDEADKYVFAAYKLNPKNSQCAVMYVHVLLRKGDKEKAQAILQDVLQRNSSCLLYTSPSPRDKRQSRMPSSA